LGFLSTLELNKERLERRDEARHCWNAHLGVGGGRKRCKEHYYNENETTDGLGN